MPFGLIHRIIIDPTGRGEGLAAIAAPNKHDIRTVACAEGSDTSQHIDIVVRAGAGTIKRQEDLASQSRRIDQVSSTYITAKIDCCALIESRNNRAIFGAGRPNAPNLACVEIHSGQEKVAVRVDIERSPSGRVRNVNWI